MRSGVPDAIVRPLGGVVAQGRLVVLDDDALVVEDDQCRVHGVQRRPLKLEAVEQTLEVERERYTEAEDDGTE